MDAHRSQLYHLSEITQCLSPQAQEKNQRSGREPGWIQKASLFDKHLGGTSLVAQWLRSVLPVQEVWVRSLVEQQKGK